MNVAVVDVGSNTFRLLVATRGPDGLACIAHGKRVVGLGAAIEREGSIPAAKLAEAAECMTGFADIARASGAALIDAVVASPGRQARNADQLVHMLARAAGVPVRILSPEEEARLAFEGALAFTNARSAVAVCDIGGGSTQIAIGTAEHGPAWLRSVDLGSLRLCARVGYSDPPAKKEFSAVRVQARRAFGKLTPPLPKEAVAVGGTARAVKKLVGRTLGAEELRGAARLLRKSTVGQIAAEHGIELWRAQALPAGVAILLEVQRLLGVPLEVGRGGLREGLALELLERLAVAYPVSGGR
jgi:exopolyphosphatase/guanosine-5'-triphosphate,3'-diphosphate pyrophosphatase